MTPFAQRLKNKVIVSFSPLGTEPQINVENGPLQVAYVRIVDWETRTMEARLSRRDLPGQWEAYSPQSGVEIYQPLPTQDLVDPAQIGVILVPGLGFSRRGSRLGRGKGFYDRYLKSVPSALRIGVGFHEQLIESIPEDTWDETIDAILTDQEWIETPSFRNWKNHGNLKR